MIRSRIVNSTSKVDDKPNCTPKGILVPCMPLWMFAKFIWTTDEHPFQLPSDEPGNEVYRFTIYDGWIVFKELMKDNKGGDYFVIERICRIPKGYSVAQLDINIGHLPKMSGLWIGPTKVMKLLVGWEEALLAIRRLVRSTVVKFKNPDHDINSECEEIDGDAFHKGSL